MTESPINVVLVDDHAIVRTGFRLLLENSSDIKVIAEAEKAFKAKPNDAAAKTALADAYFDRGFALTEARQYAAALGDYRKALKIVPDHEESQKWLDQIVSIYKMLKKEAPKEGEEPPPLPWKA